MHRQIALCSLSLPDCLCAMSPWKRLTREQTTISGFDIDSDFIGRYEIQTVAYEDQREYRIPVTDLERLNWQIIGQIDVIAACHLEREPKGSPPCLWSTAASVKNTLTDR